MGNSTHPMECVRRDYRFLYGCFSSICKKLVLLLFSIGLTHPVSVSIPQACHPRTAVFLEVLSLTWGINLPQVQQAWLQCPFPGQAPLSSFGPCLLTAAWASFTPRDKRRTCALLLTPDFHFSPLSCLFLPPSWPSFLPPLLLPSIPPENIYWAPTEYLTLCKVPRIQS